MINEHTRYSDGNEQEELFRDIQNEFFCDCCELTFERDGSIDRINQELNGICPECLDCPDDYCLKEELL